METQKKNFGSYWPVLGRFLPNVYAGIAHREVHVQLGIFFFSFLISSKRLGNAIEVGGCSGGLLVDSGFHYLPFDSGYLA